jgi:MFS family permease
MFEIFTASSTKSLIVLFILTFLYFLENFDRYLIAVSPIPFIDYSSYEYSILAGPAFAVVYTVGGLFFALGYTDLSAASSKKISKYAILSLSTFTFSFAFGMTVFAVTFWQQVIIRIVMGLAQSIITPFSTSVIRDFFPAERTGSAFGIFNTGVYFAFALSLSLGVFLYSNYGWKAGYLLFGLVGIGGSLILPCLSFLNFHQEETDNRPVDYYIVNADDLDLTSRGSNERPSFFLYDSASKAASSSTTSLPDNGSPRSPVFRNVQNNPMLGTEEKNLQRNDTVVSSDEVPAPTIKASSSSRCMSFFGRVIASCKEIAVVYWGKNWGIYLLCIATGIRLGGGYIWSSYTGVFFSDLLVKEPDSITCVYSYNSQYTSGYESSSVCDKDYPYCVSSSCNSISRFPWHNEVSLKFLLS